MLLSEEHRQLRLDYIDTRLFNLPTGEVRVDKVYISDWAEFPGRNYRYYELNGRVGALAKKLLKEREELENLRMTTLGDTIHKRKKKKSENNMDRVFFVRLSHRADSNPFVKKSFSPVVSNIKMRSKSEQNIASFLNTIGIEWIYEPCLIIEGRKIFPDFACYLFEVDKTFFIEHLGMLDNDKYLDEAMQKIKTYIKGGYIPGRDVIFTFESNDEGFDIDMLANSIDELIKNNY